MASLRDEVKSLVPETTEALFGIYFLIVVNLAGNLNAKTKLAR